MSTAETKAADTSAAAAGVTHDEASGRFVLAMDGAEVFAEYSLDGSGKAMNVYHTFTPPSLRGRGLAGRTVEAAYAYARANGLSVIPSCSYVAHYVSKHPEIAVPDTTTTLDVGADKCVDTGGEKA